MEYSDICVYPVCLGTMSFPLYVGNLSPGETNDESGGERCVRNIPWARVCKTPNTTIQRHSDLISGKCLSNNAASDPDA